MAIFKINKVITCSDATLKVEKLKIPSKAGTVWRLREVHVTGPSLNANGEYWIVVVAPYEGDVDPTSIVNMYPNAIFVHKEELVVIGAAGEHQSPQTVHVNSISEWLSGAMRIGIIGAPGAGFDVMIHIVIEVVEASKLEVMLRDT